MFNTDFVMATQTGHTNVPLMEMDFDPVSLTPSEMKKKDKMDAVDVTAKQAEDAEDVQKKFIDLVSAGNECLDERKSFQPEVKLDILIKDLFVKDLDGKKIAFHEKKARECEGCHLGGGSFGEVFKALHKVHGEVAVKVAKPGKEDRVMMYQKEAGKHVLALTSHRIVTIKGYMQCNDDACGCGLYGIVMEFMERGSLWDFRINDEWEHHPDPWPLTRRMVYHISLGMHFLHSNKIIHRDLKLENVLLDVHLEAKIADLGLATNLHTSSGDKRWGTDSHKPPEAFRTDLSSSTKVVTPKYDVYSFAMTLYELLTGIHPYAERGFDMMRLLKVDAEKTPCLQPLPPDTPDDLKRIMIKSWNYEPAHRPDFEEITEWVGKLDIVPTLESLGHYLRKSRSSKKGGKAAPPVSEPELPVNTNGAAVREGIGNLTVQDQAPAEGHGNTNTSLPAAKTVKDHESLRKKMENLNVNANAPLVLSDGNTAMPITETVTQHLVEGQQNLPTHLGQDTVGAQPDRRHSEPNPGQCGASSPQVFPRPHDGSKRRSPDLAVPSQPSSTPSSAERDPIIIFESAQPTDEDFEIELQVNVIIPVRALIKSKHEQIFSSLERCKHRAYWQNSRLPHAMQKLHEFTLQTLHLPPTLKEDWFTLFLRVSNKAALEKLHSFSKKDLLPEMLFPYFVDRHLEDLCSPMKPYLKVESREDQFRKGMAHFQKKETADDRSQPTRECRKSKSKKAKNTKSKIETGKVTINMAGAPNTLVIGNQYITYTHKEGGAGGAGGRGGAGGGGGGGEAAARIEGDGSHSSSNQSQ